ncbi:MAG: DUF3352 domain-containing protein [Phormidesmis sp.]
MGSLTIGPAIGPAWGAAEASPSDRQLAQLLPESTPVAIFLSAAEADWAALEQFELFDKIADLTGALPQSLNLTFLPPGLDRQAVQGWMGDRSVLAVLPENAPRRISVTDLNDRFVAIATLKNPEAFASFIEVLESARGEAAEKSVYEGVALWVWPTRTQTIEETVPEELKELEDFAGAKAAADGEDGPLLPEDFGAEDVYTYEVPGLAIAQIDGYVLLAQDLEALKTLIDYQQIGQTTLGDSKLFLRSQYGQTEGAIGRIYGNLAEAIKFNFEGGFLGAANVPLPPGLPNLPSFSALGLLPEARAMATEVLAGVTFDSLIYPQSEGLRFQGRLYGNDLIRATATPDLPYADSVLSFVPAPTFSLSSGRNVAGFWNRVADLLETNEVTSGFLERARTAVSAFTGLDLDKELIGWMDREFVLFFFPSNQGAINSFLPGAGIEVGVAIQTSDRPTAQAALNAFGTLTQTFAGENIATNTTVNNVPAVSWQLFTGSETVSILSHSWIAEDTVVLTTGVGAMNRLLNAPAFEPLDEHPTFINATQSLAHPNNGYSYVNAGATLSLAYGLVGKYFAIPPDDPFFVTVKSYLGTIYGLGGTTSSTNEYWQLDYLVNLAPAE